MTDPLPVLSISKAVENLLTLDDTEALETALTAAGPIVAARAVNAAPSLEQKTELLWALEDRARRQALELVPPALVGALVQNLEDDNRYLLGDLSMEQFRDLLALCSPERKFYWLKTALSFTDVRANMLPLLLPTRDLTEILLTRAEFEDHLRALGDYPIEMERIPAEMMADPAQAILDFVGADDLLRRFPVADADLAQVLQTILDWDADRYVDVIREGLRQADYPENHPEEWSTLTEDPVLLSALPRVEVPATEGPDEAELEEMSAPEGPPLALVPVGASPLTRLAAALPVAQQARVSDELQQLYIRQAIAEGGSFLLDDLARTARSVEAYLLLGLAAESAGAGAERQAAVLAGRPLHKISENGARVVERLRQVALRLRPLDAVLDVEQRAVVRSLLPPRLTVGTDGTPRLYLMPGGTLPDSDTLEAVRERLAAVAAWSELARGLGLERTAQTLRKHGALDPLLEELVLGAVLYARVELGLAEAADRARFVERYLERGTRVLRPEAQQRLQEAVTATNLSSDPGLVVAVLAGALERMAARLAVE